MSGTKRQAMASTNKQVIAYLGFKPIIWSVPALMVNLEIDLHNSSRMEEVRAET